MTQEEQGAWLGFARMQTIGAVRLNTLLEHTRHNILEAWQNIQDHAPTLFPRHANRILKEHASVNIDAELKLFDAHNIAIVTILDDDYPILLKEIHDPPPLLFYRGSLPSSSAKLASIVGSRKMTRYGQEASQLLARTCARHEITTVSGLAIGVDATVHSATLADSGKTIAVLPGSINNQHITPPRHQRLAMEIIEAGGCLLSEVAIGTPTQAFMYPIRNRLIAGISAVTVIVEATHKSGTMITARAATSENRELMAVPGPITSPLSEAPNALIRDGATPITKPEDVLEPFNIIPSTAQRVESPLNTDEQPIFNALSHEPQLIDDIARTLGKTSRDISAIITALELKCLIESVGSGYYKKI